MEVVSIFRHVSKNDSSPGEFKQNTWAPHAQLAAMGAHHCMCSTLTDYRTRCKALNVDNLL